MPISGSSSSTSTGLTPTTFTSSDGNYTGGSAQTTFTIAQASPTVNVSDAGGTYNGSAFAGLTGTRAEFDTSSR